jgi:hypothetical protein
MLVHSRVFLRQALSCWNWKCALLSATVRSIVYLTAMMRSSFSTSAAVVLVEMAYVTLTAGVYAGLQQKALGARSRALGNLIIVVGVPGLSQFLDWLAHRFLHASAPNKAILAACVFSLISALFHLHVMRNGVFLTGRGHSLVDDFRRIPRLVAGFVVRPVVLVMGSTSKADPEVESKAA